MTIYGKQVALYALRRHPRQVRTVYLTKKGLLPKDLLEEFGPRIKIIENRWAQSMSRGGNHQGILLEIEPWEPAPFESIRGQEFVVVLDGLTDVGNIGAIVRTAYALGVDALVATGVRQLNFAAIVRSSSGALLDMPFALHRNIADVLHELGQQGSMIYGATMGGVPVEGLSFPRKKTLVLGSEGEGLSKRALRHLDRTISVEMKREFDSLNVSAAAAIIIDRMSYAVE